MTSNLLRKIPSVDRIKNSEIVGALAEDYGEEQVSEAVRIVLEVLRAELQGAEDASFPTERLEIEAIAAEMGVYLENKFTPSLRKAVNATGVIMHTGLGRAAFPAAAQAALAEVAEGYCTLATDIETGRRSHRDNHLEDLICELTGAEAATVVNNNAAATMLILNTLAQGREVIVSRGQLVEIGGAFRMPDVMAASGAVLREVGTTNKTHLRDYRDAINEQTSAIMRVHHSNYRIVGFAEEPPIEDLAGLAREHGLYIIDDIGSGALVDLSRWGIEHEPQVQDSVRAGVDVACFSGDKLIGGPQSGFILGKREAVDRIRKNQLARALRIGKLTIAGLEATLKLFLRPDRLVEDHPVYWMFSRTAEEVGRRTRRLIRRLKSRLPEGAAELSLIDGGSQVGSGAVPVETIPTKLLHIRSPHSTAEKLSCALRRNAPPVFPRVHQDALLLDLRTVLKGEDRIVEDALVDVLNKESDEK
ncbi:MAG: L-seryl-tRNA(Sec) selenium transferase [Candidatus Aminicenantaceae bacterium]